MCLCVLAFYGPDRDEKGQQRVCDVKAIVAVLVFVAFIATREFGWNLGIQGNGGYRPLVLSFLLSSLRLSGPARTHCASNTHTHTLRAPTGNVSALPVARNTNDNALRHQTGATAWLLLLPYLPF
jgi:hypothetical protein